MNERQDSVMPTRKIYLVCLTAVTELLDASVFHRSLTLSVDVIFSEDPPINVHIITHITACFRHSSSTASLLKMSCAETSVINNLRSVTSRK